MINVFREFDGQSPVEATVRINDYKQELSSRLTDIRRPYNRDDLFIP
jgi:hypothetical protein